MGTEIGVAGELLRAYHGPIMSCLSGFVSPSFSGPNSNENQNESLPEREADGITPLFLLYGGAVRGDRSPAVQGRRAESTTGFQRSKGWAVQARTENATLAA